ncbi:MAG TPA: DUF2851 family protein [Prolixibacteraceae bacterium]|nr:DUF2851 family protein [Lentimicrobium sp.]HLN73062.1 DUF2851 family protein [Prolixibacteraceae bacterium]
MTEDFLHYLWQNKLFKEQLTTTEQVPVTVLNPGFHNLHAGPDFSDARLNIGGTIWAGNVEIHVNSSDWFRHGHQNDDAYKNVVLHVVFNDDSREAHNEMPVCELSGKFDLRLFEKYKDFIESRKFVPCAGLLHEIPFEELTLWLERMLIEKLESKADFIQNALDTSQNDWEEALYQILARSFGFNVNALPFEMLARSVSYKILAKHADSRFQIEALLFGQAGMLTHDLIDTYGQSLFKEYAFLRKKYSLVPLDPSLWKFLRLRPVNFPTIRIAQFASFLSLNAGILGAIISKDSIDELFDLFKINASEYWSTHYTFDKSSMRSTKKLGNTSQTLLIINALLPFLFVYGRSVGNDALCNKALNFYENLPGESNSIVKEWESIGMRVENAWQTQALLALKFSYCDKRKCLNCRIGTLLMKEPLLNSFIK